MHIEIKLSSDYSQRERERLQLEHDLRKWTRQHNIDINMIRLQYASDRNVERVYIHNDRALELFCLCWPHTQFTLQR